MSNQERYITESPDPSVLGEHITLPFSGLVAKSRFMKAAMSERMSSFDQKDHSKRGVPSENLINLYDKWGKGGWGIILTGNVIVNPIDLEAPGNAVVSKALETPERISAFSRLAQRAKDHGSLVFMQISHGGRQVLEILNPHPVSASDLQLKPAFGMTFAKPTALTKEGIDDLVDQFVYAAQFAYKTGFDGIELHGAHGYIFSQFYSKSSNKRTDEYGGELHNRARLLYRVVEEIKKGVNDTSFGIAVKINSVEFQEGGFQPEECREVCVRLQDLGVDFIELSGGTLENLTDRLKLLKETSRVREAVFLEAADVVRDALTKTKLYVTGTFRTARAMVAAVKNRSTDGIGIGRPAGEEPDFADLIIQGKIPSARKSLFDETDILTTNMLAGAQLEQIGAGLKSLNSSDPKDVQEFKEKLNLFIQRIGELAKAGIIEAGYLSIIDKPIPTVV